MANKLGALALWSLLALSNSSLAIDDSSHALMLAMKAKALVGHQNTSIPPGNQGQQIRHRRGGINPQQVNNAGCGGVAIGNVAPVLGDSKAHKTVVIIQGHIINTGNNC